MLQSKHFNSTGYLSSFSSKVPICTDRKPKNNLPGPGQYDSKAMKNGESNTLGHIVSTDNISTMTADVTNPFLSKAARGEMWMADRDAPYTRQTFATNPAPNAYFDSKKKDDIRARLLAEETVTIPFGSKDERPLNKPDKEVNPGPGNYIDIYSATNSSVASKLTKIQEDRSIQKQQGCKVGAFGSNAERDAFWAKPKDGPAPGHYFEKEGLSDVFTEPLEIIAEKKPRV